MLEQAGGGMCKREKMLVATALAKTAAKANASLISESKFVMIFSKETDRQTDGDA